MFEVTPSTAPASCAAVDISMLRPALYVDARKLIAFVCDWGKNVHFLREKKCNENRGQSCSLVVSRDRLKGGLPLKLAFVSVSLWSPRMSE